jgi:Raf kinase inhibitor-like YbhB/YbcL family protein
MGTWVHWVIFDIPGAAQGLPEGVPTVERLPDGSLQGRNSWDRIGYGGSSPPPGKPHRYPFRRYALPAPIGLAPGAAATDVETLASTRALERAEYLGRYGRARD